MSQKKMDAYKEAKKNKKQNEKKQKRNRVLAWICGILVFALLVTGVVFLVKYTQDNANTAVTTSTDSSEATAQDVTQILQQSLGEGDYTISTEPVDAGDSETVTDEAAE